MTLPVSGRSQRQTYKFAMTSVVTVAQPVIYQSYVSSKPILQFDPVINIHFLDTISLETFKFKNTAYWTLLWVSMLATLATGRSHRRLLSDLALGFLLRHELGTNVFSLARSVSTTCVLCAKERGRPKKAELSEKKLVGYVSELNFYTNVYLFVFPSVLGLNTVAVKYTYIFCN